MENNGILSILKQYKTELLQRYELQEIAVFGSVAKNTHQPESDLDLLVFPKPFTIFSYKKLISLELFLQSIIPIKKIDIVNSRYINPVIKASAENHIVYV
ncbi:MAG: nucleotidyltransferase domain-containing protein [Chitinophagaceae bacterium]|jgi:hypothetical protein|nr:nucleotidyltransferase domain-containing protein [Chitinophagaceae bacterium]